MKKMMRVFLMSLLCGVLPFTMLFGGVSVAAYTGNSTQTLTSGADIRVMSYNTLVDNDENNGGWSWGKPLADRAEKAAAAINYYKPDVIGLQENNYNWHVALRKLLPDYDYVNANVPMSMPLEKKESLGKKDWMCTTMMYNTKTLEMVDYELIGYSVNYWGCIQRMRYLSMALFKVKATGEMFVFTSTHFDAEKDSRGAANRVTQAGEMAENIQRYKETYGCPVISTGDFNSGYSDDPIKNIREATGMDSHSNNRGGIDYILYSQGVSPKYFTVINDADLSGASDHQPIMADLTLQNGFSFPTTTIPTATTTTATTTTTTTTRSSAFKPTTATTAKPIATQATTTTTGTWVTTAPSVADSTENSADTTTSQLVGDSTTTVPLDSTSTATVTAAEEETMTTTITSATEQKPTTGTTKGNKKDDQKDDGKKGKDNVGIAIGIAVAIAAVGVIAAVAAVLISKKKK